MAKPNYHQAKKQKEAARKARQQEKQQRREARVNPAAPETEPTTVQVADGPREAGSESAT